MDFVGTGDRLTDRDFARTANSIDIPVPTLQGVVDVEAAGKGFDADKRPKILPEPHVFFKRLGKGPKRNKAVKAGLAYAKWGTKPYPKSSDANYARLKGMIAIDEKAALESTSWGLAQIMGFNFKDAGFESAKAMVLSFMKGEGEQLAALVRLIDAWDLEDDLQRRDARGFARAYNGPGYAKNGYDSKLQKAWSRRDRQKAPPVSDELPTETREPTPPPPPPVLTPDRELVRKVQEELRRLGYYNTGPVDGDLTPDGMTEAAILDFRNRNDLPLTPTIDATLLEALKAAKPKEVAPERAEATVTELQKQDTPVAETLRQSWWQKYITAAGGFFAGIIAIFNGILSKLGDATAYLEPVKNFVGDIPVWMWCALIVFVCAVIFWSARKTEKSQVEMYRTGQVT